MVEQHADPTEQSGRLWIISQGRVARFNARGPSVSGLPDKARQYRISALGRYLISDEPVVISGILAGCRVIPQARKRSAWRRWRGKLFSDPSGGAPQDTPLTLVSSFFRALPTLESRDLSDHIRLIYKHLEPYDPFWEALGRVMSRQPAGIQGICVDTAGAETRFYLKGSTEEQLTYIKTFLGRVINVQLDRAHIADGLFEMRGFDFKTYDPAMWFRLVKFAGDKENRACVLRQDHTVDFWVSDERLILWLELIEQSVRNNRRMQQSFWRCVAGKATPARLMLNHSIEIDYRRSPLPAIIKEVISQHNTPGHVVEMIKQSLNRFQVGVSFNSLPISEEGANTLCTDISVLQDVRALEPIKASLPGIYAHMDSRAEKLDAGRFYMLDTIRGYRDGA